MKIMCKKVLSIIMVLVLSLTTFNLLASANSIESNEQYEKIIYEYFEFRTNNLMKKNNSVAEILKDISNMNFNLSTEVAETEALRSEGYNSNMDSCNINVSSATLISCEVSDIIKNGDCISLNAYEGVKTFWTDRFNDETQTSEFGTWHEIKINKGSNKYEIIEDRYYETDITGVCTELKSNSFEIEETEIENEIMPIASTLKKAHLDISKMITYANTYTSASSGNSSYNKQYTVITDNDCMNFASQCLYAGGLEQVSGSWYYNNNGTTCSTSSHSASASHSCTKDDTYSASWTSCNSFISFAKNNYYNKYEDGTLSPSKFIKGDLFFSYNSSGNIGHVMVVVASNSDYVTYNAHTTNRKNYTVGTSYFSSNKTARLHIHDCPTSYTKKSSTQHTMKCETCNAVIETTSHTLSGWRTSNTHHWKGCSGCSYTTTAKEAHKFVFKSPYYTCSVCGYKTTITEGVASITPDCNVM